MAIKVPCKPDSAIYTLQVESEQAVLGLYSSRDTCDGRHNKRLPATPSSVLPSLLEAQEPRPCSLWRLQHDARSQGSL